jgi:hypothetical protein
MALFANERAFQPIHSFVNSLKFGFHQVFEVVEAFAHIVEALFEGGPEVGHTRVLVEEADDDGEANQKRRSPLAQDSVGDLHWFGRFFMGANSGANSGRKLGTAHSITISQRQLIGKAGGLYTQEVVTDTNVTVAIMATSASMLTGIFGMWINASQTGKRIDDLRRAPCFSR